jgi:hypothetical protein
VPLLKNMFANERRKAKVRQMGSRPWVHDLRAQWHAPMQLANPDMWCLPQVLNFSIAYGKTAHGLSKDFKTSLEEAQETVNKWYADRPEVRSAGAAMQGLLLCRAL